MIPSPFCGRVASLASNTLLIRGVPGAKTVKEVEGKAVADKGKGNAKEGNAGKPRTVNFLVRDNTILKLNGKPCKITDIKKDDLAMVSFTSKKLSSLRRVTEIEFTSLKPRYNEEKYDDKKRNPEPEKPSETLAKSTSDGPMVDNSAQLATIRELFHGQVEVLPDGQLELIYDFSKPVQLEDFDAVKGGETIKTSVSPWQIRDGTLRKISPDDALILQKARFCGPVTITVSAEEAKGEQCALGYQDSKSGGQLMAGVKDKPATAFLALDGKVIATGSPMEEKPQEWVLTVNGSELSLQGIGGQPLVAPRTDKASNHGQFFMMAPEATMVIRKLKITGRLEWEWFRDAVDAQMVRSKS